jgi:hypothetical protein
MVSSIRACYAHLLQTSETNWQGLCQTSAALVSGEAFSPRPFLRWQTPNQTTRQEVPPLERLRFQAGARSKLNRPRLPLSDGAPVVSILSVMLSVSTSSSGCATVG